ncbi:MAG: chloride channel protein [Bryobacterales bacterium]
MCFHISIEFFNWRTVHGLGHRAWWAVALWPAVGGVVSFALAYFLFPTARGSGVNYTKAALFYVSDGYMPFSGVTGKFLCSTIFDRRRQPDGSGGPGAADGRGHCVAVGASVPVDSRAHAANCAGGRGGGHRSGVQHATITAVLFVMEEVVAAWNAGVLGSIVLAAVSAVVVSRWFLGDEPLYSVPEFFLTDYRELIVYALVGVLSGYLSAGFTRFVAHVRERAKSLPRKAVFLMPFLAGLAVGVVGIWIPEVFGAGYGAIDSALHDRYVWHFLLLLGGLKMASTALCVSAGTPGGMFAPALFIGAMIGGGLGGLAHEYWPFATSSAGAYVLVGIGTFFAGLFRAPMTSIFMVFEISANYVIILPVMIANTISFLISRHLQHESLFQIVGRQDGFDLPSVEEQREALPLSVEDAMRSGSAAVMPGSMRVAEAFERLHQERGALSGVGLRQGLVLGEEGRSRESDRERRFGQDRLSRAAAADRRSAVPDLSLDSALRLLGNCTPSCPSSAVRTPTNCWASSRCCVTYTRLMASPRL